MATFYLIRHGQKLSEFGNPGLTETGFRQALETGNHLKQLPITTVISSPLRRTTETAIAIGKALNLTPSFDIRLVERANWDHSIKKQTFNEFALDWFKATHDRDYVMQIGDSSRRTGERVESVVQELTASDKHIVLVSHGGTIVDYLRNVFGDDSITSMRHKYEDLGYDYQIMNCSITVISLNGRPKIDLLHYTDHLSEVTE